MGKKNSLRLSVLSERETLFYGDCSAVSVPTQSDIITILPFHTPLIAKLVKGEIIVYSGSKKQKIADIKNGLIYVGDNTSVILVNF